MVNTPQNTSVKVFKEKAGVISKKECWVCFESCWMYTADTLVELYRVVKAEWRQDTHLWG